jgi:outer membrane protein assembly factor BamB
MENSFDGHADDLLARGGTFDITGTGAVTNKQFWGFNASDGAVLDTLKGIPVTGSLETLAEITAAEVDISGILLTAKTDPLFAGVIYRVDGYIITNVKLTSGSLHCYKTKNPVSA